MTPIRSITGLQPTGSIHLGNYFGAIKPFVDRLSGDHQDAIFIADYHAITSGFDPKTLEDNIQNLAAMLIACGADRAMLFQQSAISQHTELAWVLQSTTARFGWLNRMVQFKDKQEKLGENSEGVSVGLFTYPVLQAADILLYDAEEVPVGEDQAQHLELTRDIAVKFNRQFGDTFVVPRARVMREGGRVMSLYDAKQKMSKSDPDDMTRINLTDDPDVVARKIKRATSDSALIPDSVADLEHRPELRNLLTLYGLATGITLEASLGGFAGQGYGRLKPALVDALVAFLDPLQARYREALGNTRGIVAQHNREASQRADFKMLKIKRKMGVLVF